MASETSEEGAENRGGTRIPWALLLEVVGAGAAIAAWIAVVGGARIWARLHAADIPATQALSLLPRNLLIVEGLQALLVPLLIGGGVALFVYFSREGHHPRRRPRRARRARAVRGLHIREVGLKAWLRGGTRYSAPGRAIRTFRRVFEPETQAAIAALVAIALLLLTLAIVRVEWWWIMGATLLGALFALASTVRRSHPAPATGAAGGAQAGGGADERDSRNPAVAAIGAAAAVGVAVGALALALGLSPGQWRWAVLAGEVVAVLVLALALRLWFPAARFLVAAAALVAAPLIGAVIAFALVVEWDYLLAIGLLTVGVVWLAFGALPGRGAGGVAVTLFAGLALWSGTVGFLRLAGARDPQLESVDLTLRDGTRIDDGFYIGRKGDEIFVATNEPRRLRVLKESEVSTLGVGDLVDAAPEEEAAGGDDGDDSAEEGPTMDDLPLGTPSTLEHRDTVVKTIDGVRLVLEVFEPRQSEALLVLDLRLTNDPGPDEPGMPFTIGGVLDDGEADARSGSADTLDGLEIVDRANEAHYPVARTEDGRCVCSRSLRRITLAPGESTYLWAAFKRPAGDAELELHVPPPFRTLDLGEE